MKKFRAAAAAVFLICMTVGCAGRPAKTEEPIILRVLAGQSTSDAGVEDMIDEWMEEHYPEVTLEWECVDWGDWFSAQIRGRIAAGDLPDIVIGKAQDVQAYAGSGNLGTFPESCSDQINEQALRSVLVDGEVYGLPYNAWYQGVLYNKKLFQELGLTVPVTTKEMEALIKRLEEEGITPFASHFQESWSVANMTMQHMMNEVFLEEPDWGDRFREGEVDFQGNEKIRHCFEENEMILQASWEDALRVDQYESDSRFIQGEAAMYLTGSWSMQFVNQYGADMEFGIFPWPNESGDAKLIRETNMTFMKSAETSYGGLIDDILRDLLADEALAQEILDFTQSSPVVKEPVEGLSSKLKEDIDRYESGGQVVDVTIGNVQLVWNFQNAVAAEQQLWLKKEMPLDAVLAYADEHREDSSYSR